MELCKQKLLDFARRLIASKSNPHCIYNRDCRLIDIFYIGLGKTGSSSLRRGFPDNNCAHFHNTEDAFKSDSVFLQNLERANLNIYDVVLEVAKQENYKPLIIETVREPISLAISTALQHLKRDRGNCACELCEWKRGKKINFESFKDTLFTYVRGLLSSNPALLLPHSYLFGKSLGVDILNGFDYNQKKYFKETKSIKFLLTRFEEIDSRKHVMSSLGYNYTDSHVNSSVSPKSGWNLECPTTRKIFELYKKLKNSPDGLTFSSSDLNLIYNNEVYAKLYSPKEIDSFIEKYAK